MLALPADQPDMLALPAGQPDMLALPAGQPDMLAHPPFCLKGELVYIHIVLITKSLSALLHTCINQLLSGTASWVYIVKTRPS